MSATSYTNLPPPLPGKTGWPWDFVPLQFPKTMPGGAPWPRISIVTPSYNQGQFLEETIRSVLLQGYPNLEYIVIDGGSVDQSVEIIKKYEPWLAHWESETDRGQTHAINKGLQRATGDIVAWLNSDDLYAAPDILRFVATFFRKNTDVGVMFGDYALIGADSRLLKIHPLPRFNYRQMLRGFYMCQPSTFWRASILMTDLLDESLNYAMDYEYFLRIGKKHKIVHVRRIIAGDRNHPGRKILANRTQVQEETRIVQRRFGQTFGAGFYWGRLIDKLQAGGPSRILGAIYILGGVLRLRPMLFRTDNLMKILYQQLFNRNHEII